jgi:hypothetical protein
VENRRSIVPIIVVIGIALLIVFIPYVIKNTITGVIDSAVSPFEQSSQQLETQMADLLHPTPTIMASPETIVHEIRGMAQLTTVQYTLEKVITAEIGQGAFAWLTGDKLLFIAHGYVRAGVDLEKIDPEDIRVVGTTVYINLPDPEIFVATLDNDKSYVYDREMGLLTHGDPNLETSARRVAEDEIEKAAIEGGILDIAKQNAEAYVSVLLQGLDFTEIVFED